MKAVNKGSDKTSPMGKFGVKGKYRLVFCENLKTAIWFFAWGIMIGMMEVEAMNKDLTAAKNYYQSVISDYADTSTAQQAKQKMSNL